MQYCCEIVLLGNKCCKVGRKIVLSVHTTTKSITENQFLWQNEGKTKKCRHVLIDGTKKYISLQPYNSSRPMLFFKWRADILYQSWHGGM